MQRLITLLSAVLVLIFNVSLAQNCPSNPTYKNTSATYNFTNAGTSYVANNGSSYNVTISGGFSSTSSICVTNGSTLNLSFSSLTNLVAGGIIYVDATSTLNFAGSNVGNFPFTINNYGTINQGINITYQDGAVVNNYGNYNTTNSVIFSNRITTVNNSGTMSLLGTVTFANNTASTDFDFIFTNTVDGSITIKNNVTLNRVKFTNKGTVNFNGSVTIQNDCSFANSGYTSCNNGVLTVSKSLITNFGVFTTNSDVKINTSANLDNYCTFLQPPRVAFSH